MIIKLITKLNRNTYCLLTKGSSAFRPSPMVWGAERESSQSRLLLWRLNMRKTLGQLRQGLSHPKHDLVGGAITIWLVIIPITLSGWWFQPLLKNMSSSIGLMKFQIWWGKYSTCSKPPTSDCNILCSERPFCYGSTCKPKLLPALQIQIQSYPIGSMYAIYGNMDPINIPQSC